MGTPYLSPSPTGHRFCFKCQEFVRQRLCPTISPPHHRQPEITACQHVQSRKKSVYSKNFSCLIQRNREGGRENPPCTHVLPKCLQHQAGAGQKPHTDLLVGGREWRRHLSRVLPFPGTSAGPGSPAEQPELHRVIQPGAAMARGSLTCCSTVSILRHF